MHRKAANCKTIPAAVTGSQRLARSLSILDGAVGKKARQKCGAAIKSWQWAFLPSEPFTADSHVLSLYFSLSLLLSGSFYCTVKIFSLSLHGRDKPRPFSGRKDQTCTVTLSNSLYYIYLGSLKNLSEVIF